MPKYTLPLTNNLYIRNMKSYLLLAEDNLKMFNEQNKDFIEKRLAEHRKSDWLEEASHLSNIEWLFLNSIFVTLYASFEHFLMKVVATLEQQPDINIKLAHMSGRGILEQYTNYLHLVGGLKSASRERAPWGRLSHYQNARNFLAHNGGIILETAEKNIEKNKDYKFLKEEKVGMLGRLGQIRIRNTQILESFIADTTLLTNNILNEFNAKYRPNPAEEE